MVDMATIDPTLLERAKQALHDDDAAAMTQILDENADVRAMVNAKVGDFNSPPILAVKSEAMLDVLLAAGADINAKSDWWAGGFGLLHVAPPDVAEAAITKGATVDAHAAARLDKLDELRRIVAARPEVVHERGGDGQTPLHFAATREIADFLLQSGADIDAKDVDHESTPAQWMIGSRQDVARFLIERGCQTDLLMLAALGDDARITEMLDSNPEGIRIRVSSEHFPMIGSKAGGTIYQWELGWYVSAHLVALKFGHETTFDLLMSRSPDDVKLLAYCWLGDEEKARALVAAHPSLVSTLREEDLRQVAHAARNNDLPAMKLMLEMGCPVTARSQHEATPLHWAAYHGNADMVREILPYGPDLEARDRDFNGTPLGWAMHGSQNGWYVGSGDHGQTATLLLQAGAKRPEQIYGSEAVLEALGQKAD